MRPSDGIWRTRDLAPPAQRFQVVAHRLRIHGDVCESTRAVASRLGRAVHGFAARHNMLLLVTSCIAYVLSEEARFGDATTYANEIRAGAGAVIEPGHVLWRPLGCVIGHALGTLDTLPLTSFAGMSPVSALPCSSAGSQRFPTGIGRTLSPAAATHSGFCSRPLRSTTRLRSPRQFASEEAHLGRESLPAWRLAHGRSICWLPRRSSSR